MKAQSDGFDLSSGTVILRGGVEWTIEHLVPQLGKVSLVAHSGEREALSIRSLINDPTVRASSRDTILPALMHARQPPTVDDLTETQKRVLALRVGNLLEVETGYRSGDPTCPGLGEPREGYDPEATTITQRRHTKVDELATLDRDYAQLLGLERVGYRTLIRWQSGWRRFGTIGVADGRWLRTSGGHPCVTEVVREAIYAARMETLHRRGRVSLRTKQRLIHQYLRKCYGPETTEEVPHTETLRVIWREWFGSGRARQRYQRSTPPAPTGEHVVIHRPGQVVALDTTVLPVKLRETVFGDPVSVHLTLGLDIHTHSMCGFRLTLVSDTSVDVAMLLRDIAMPLPMRPDWGEDMEWPYPGLPASMVAEFAGHRVAGLPFFSPETITTDHGPVYRNHHLVEAQRVLGTNILPARVLRPTDKQAVERAFGAARSMLFESLLGYTGVDVADRGTDPEADAILTIDQMEHLIATWIVQVWQNHRLGDHTPWWDPGGEHSPNTLFAVSMAQGGFALRIPDPELYYQLLPVHHVKIHGARGVKIRGLWYNGDALDHYRAGPSTRGGKHKGKWVIRSDPRDARTVFFQDPRSHDWHALRWTGLPPGGEMPAFGDARVHELLSAARKSGLRPRSDAELLPMLLDLLDANVPVDAWPTLSKTDRTDHSRETARAAAAHSDRPTITQTAAVVAERATGIGEYAQRSRAAADAVDSERRRRRTEALASIPIAAPRRLGDEFRRNNPFLLAFEAGSTDDKEDTT